MKPRATCLLVAGSFVLALALFICTVPLHAQWVKTNSPDSVRTLTTANGAVVYAGTRSGIFLSLDSGTSWTAMNNGLTHTNVRAIILRPGMVFVGTEGGGVFRSTNNGASWTPVNNGLTGLDIRAFAFYGGHLFAGTNNGIFRSADSGTSWAAFNNGLVNLNIQALATTGSPPSRLYAGTAGSGVFQLANGDSSWSAYNASLTNLDVRAFGNDSWLFCVGTGTDIFWWNVFISSPSWKPVTGIPSLGIHSLAGATSEGILAGTAGGGVFLVLDGYTGSAINDGLTDLHVHAVSTYESFAYGYLFIGTPSGVWRRSKSEVIPPPGSIKSSADSPMRFRLDGHRSVSFTLASPSRVSLIAHKPTGEKAAVLFAGELPAGAHERRIDAATLPNGLYFYRLQAGNVTEARKVLLVR